MAIANKENENVIQLGRFIKGATKMCGLVSARLEGDF